MNKVYLKGFVKEPVKHQRVNGNGLIISFFLRVYDRKRDTTSEFWVETFGKVARAINGKVSPDSHVIVEGQLRQDRGKTKVVADKVFFLEKEKTEGEKI